MRNVKEERGDIEMEKFFIDIGNSTGRYEGVYLDIANFLANFTDIESLDKLPPHRYRGAIQVVLFFSQRMVVTSFPACRTQLLGGQPRTSETIAYPTLLVEEAIFHFFTIDARPTILRKFARRRITKIHLFHITNLRRATYCANFVGRTDSPTPPTDRNY